MELIYKRPEIKEKEEVRFGKKYNEVFIATCNEADDRLVFIQEGKMVMALNLIDKFVIQSHHDLSLYSNYKRVSKLELAVILEAE